MDRVEEILTFWFGADETERRNRNRVWFSPDPEFDQACVTGFLADHELAAAGALNAWMNQPRSCLALILLLDQFPRNMFRGTPRAFATDHEARTAARHAVEHGFDAVLPAVERSFVYLPFQHSEQLDDQLESIRLNRALADDDPNMAGYVRYAEQHMEVIRRFGRFPARNAILGRPSAPAELEFLAGGKPAI
jgi:uncharacterized protein (DUF924 family)